MADDTLKKIAAMAIGAGLANIDGARPYVNAAIGMRNTRRARQQDEEDRAWQREQRQRVRDSESRQKVQEFLRMREAGAVPDAETRDSTLHLPNVMGGLGGTGGFDVHVPKAGRYQSVPDTGFAVDTWNTGDAKKRIADFAAQRKAREGRDRRHATITARARAENLDLTPEEIDTYADDPDLFEDWMRQAWKPDPIEQFRQKRRIVVENPLPSRPRSSSPRSSDPTIGQRRQLTTVERQISDTQREIGALTREQRDRPDAGTAEDPIAARADSTNLARRRQQLEARRDSLGGVRDSLAGVMTRGRSTPRGAASELDVPDAPDAGDVDFRKYTLGNGASAAMQAEFDAAAARYRRLLDRGVDPDRAREAYDATLRQIATKHGAAR